MRVEPWVEFYFYGVLLTSMCLFGISANTVTLFILNAFNEMRRQPINVYLTVLAIYDNGVLINALLMLGIPALVTNSKQNPSEHLPSVFSSLDSVSSASSPSSGSSVNSIHSSLSSPLSSSPSSSVSSVSSSISTNSLSSSSSTVNLHTNLRSDVSDHLTNFKLTDPLIISEDSFDYTASNDYLARLQSTIESTLNLTFNNNKSTVHNSELANSIEPWPSPNDFINLNPSLLTDKSDSYLPAAYPPTLYDLAFAQGYNNPNDLPPLLFPQLISQSSQAQSATTTTTVNQHHHHQHANYPLLSSFPFQPTPQPFPPSYTQPPDDPLHYYVTFVYPMALISQTGSIWTTCLITAERYFAVCHPFRIRTFSNRNRAIWAVIFLSLGAFLYNLPRFFEIEVFTTSEGIRSVRQTALRQNRLYYWLYYICLNLALLYIIPLSLLTALNTEIYKAVRRASRNRATLTNQEETELNIASMLVLLVSIFIACNAPAFVVNCMEFFNAPGYEMATIFSNLLVCLNSSINFVIYCIFGKKFRKKLSQVFHCSKLPHQDRLGNSYQARLNNTATTGNIVIHNHVNHANTHNINNDNDTKSINNNVNLHNNTNIAIATANSMHAINETYV